ncbi:MAG: hypothetical protein JNL62_22935 [Bryobacterales bacterium]|nr:hypothetical protein [Bryobacterales bacterium]
MPAIGRAGDVDLGGPSVEIYPRGLTIGENAVFVALGTAPQGDQLRKGFAGVPVFAVTAANCVKLRR